MYHQQRKLPLEIKKSNELVRAQLNVENNALANKLFCLLIRNLTPKDFPEISVSVKELTAIQGSGGYQYKAIKTAANVLSRARVDSLFYDDKGQEIGFDFTNIFGHCRYKNGEISAKFNPDMKPHLLELKSRFTILNYFELMELSSFYSQRVYELLKSWEKPTGIVELDLEIFYDIISYPKDLRNNFASVRRYALEQAEKDINGRTELKFKWEPIKEGRKVMAIRFIIGEVGDRTLQKRQTQDEEKAKQKTHDDAKRRAPYLAAGRECRQEHGIKPGSLCKLAKPRSKKCQLCNQTAEVSFYNELLFD